MVRASKRPALALVRYGIAALAAASVLALGGPLGAGEEPETTTIVRKVVDGPASAGTTVVVECSFQDDQDLIVSEIVLRFDATGAPTTVSGDDAEDWAAVDGAWVESIGRPVARTTCTFTETDAGGAAGTTWTCDYEAELGTEPEGLGCAAPSGEGTGPATVVLADFTDEIIRQETTVVFTNTYAPEAQPVVEVTPAFTG